MDDYVSFFEWRWDYIHCGKRKWGSGNCWEYFEGGTGCEYGLCEEYNHPTLSVHKMGATGTVVEMSNIVPMWCNRLRSLGFVHTEKQNQPIQEISGETICAFGKHRGEKYSDIVAQDKGYVHWILGTESNFPEFLHLQAYCQMQCHQTDYDVKKWYHPHLSPKNVVHRLICSYLRPEMLQSFDQFRRNSFNDSTCKEVYISHSSGQVDTPDGPITIHAAAGCSEQLS
mmetsp:Transcript_11838/g.19244  ORF Transcript_11838/g.19244 Transcript_11838/m.19244 type:complete len:227 (+) Transcript_11838:152-832(+)